MHRVMWGIWKEMNMWLFKGKTSRNSDVIDFVVRDVGNWISVLKKFQDIPSSLLHGD